MADQFLWIDHTKAPSRASDQVVRQRQARIRSHVQTHHRSRATTSKTADVSTADPRQLQPPAYARSGVPASSLRPNVAFGRPKSKSSERSKRQRTTKAGIPSGARKEQLRGVQLTRSLPFLWHGFSSRDRGSLAFFQLRTSQEWSGYEDAYFWTDLALRISQQSEAVARSLIAVSALHEGTETLESNERIKLQRVSREQGSRATTALLARSDLSHFEALMSCLVMIPFHGLQNCRAAFTLLRSGTKLLEESTVPGSMSHDECWIVEHHIRPLFRRLLSRPCSMADIQGSFLLSAEQHRARSAHHATEPPSVAHTFASLPEARDRLESVLDWAHDNLPTFELFEPSRETFLRALHRLIARWEASLAASCFEKTARSIKAQKLLQAACLIGMVLIDSTHCAQETAFDKYEADFGEALSLLQNAWRCGHSFGIDAGLMDMTAFVGTKCRNPDIRRHALRLLKSRDRLEGERVAADPAAILEGLIALEERGLNVVNTSDVPEQNRRRLIWGQQHRGRGRIDLFYSSPDNSRKEKCSVSPAALHSRKKPETLYADAEIPDAIFGQGYAAYLEDRDTKRYFRLDLDRFYFPIPKV